MTTKDPEDASTTPSFLFLAFVVITVVALVQVLILIFWGCPGA